MIMMRKKFNEQMDLLNTMLLEMGALIEQAIANSTIALTNRDSELAKSVYYGDRLVNEKEKEIEHLCLSLILREQPVASDLRTISAALKMVTDMERIGDQAADIAEITCVLSQIPPIVDLELIEQMMHFTSQMVKESIDAYVKKDLELASKVIDDDNNVDELFVKMRATLINMISESDNQKFGEQALDVLMIAKYLERIADHAVNIAEWVIFSITGEHKSYEDVPDNI